jgi:hypothetical protein
MAREQGWRSDIRRYLMDHMDDPFPLRDLFDAVHIPLHAASRLWMSRDRTELGSNDHMRFCALVNTLQLYQLGYDPPKERQKSRDTLVIVRPLICQHCQQPFVGRRAGKNRPPQLHCSLRCASFSREVRKNAARQANHEPTA